MYEELIQQGSTVAVTDGGAISTIATGIGISATGVKGVNLDAFARLRVSEPTALFDSKLLYDLVPEHWGTIEEGGGACVHGGAFEPAAIMSVDAVAGSRVVRQTYRYMTYQPGRSLLLFLTGVQSTDAGVRSRIGYFDADQDKTAGNDSGGDGVYWEVDENNANWMVMRSSVGGTPTESEIRIPQSQWSVDHFDGTGPSKITLNNGMSQILFMDIEWLGVGTVRIGFVINGVPYYAHEFHYANMGGDSVYMRSATLPVRYEIESVDGSAGSMKQICSTVISEGGFNPRGTIRSVDVGTAKLTTSTSRQAILSISLQRAANRATLNPVDVSISTDDGSGARTIQWEIWKNADISPITSPEWESAGYGAVSQYTVYPTLNSIDNAILVASGYMADGSSLVTAFQNTILCNSDIAGTPDNLTLVVRTVKQNVDCWGSFRFQEWF